jgi:hypothetical protein
MIVRYERRVGFLVGAFFGGAAWWALASAGDPSIYGGNYHGIAALFGLLMRATRDAEIFGQNPVLLGAGIFYLIFVAVVVRALLTGVVARVQQDTIHIPNWFWSKSVEIADIVEVERIPMMSGQVCRVIIRTKDGRRSGISGANSDDAAKLVELIRLTLPASPANPPAT